MRMLRNYLIIDSYLNTVHIFVICYSFLVSLDPRVTLFCLYSTKNLIIQCDVAVKKDNDTVHLSLLFSLTKERHSPFAPCVVVSEREWAHFIFQMATG